MLSAVYGDAINITVFSLLLTTTVASDSLSAPYSTSSSTSTSTSSVESNSSSTPTTTTTGNTDSTGLIVCTSSSRTPTSTRSQRTRVPTLRNVTIVGRHLAIRQLSPPLSHSPALLAHHPAVAIPYPPPTRRRVFGLCQTCSLYMYRYRYIYRCSIR